MITLENDDDKQMVVCIKTVGRVFIDDSSCS